MTTSGLLATEGMAVNPFDDLYLQPRVQKFLSNAVHAKQVAQAYLFLGQAGIGQKEASTDLALALLCPLGGCKTCSQCKRVLHGTHPDVYEYTPASQRGYLIDQVKEIINATQKAPLVSTHKVFIIHDAHRLRSNTANALLKTIEEPPEDTVFVLSAPTSEQVLSTIVSRCQCTPFRSLSEQEALALVQNKTGCTPVVAKQALWMCESPELAKEYIFDPCRLALRDKVIQTVQELKNAQLSNVLLLASDMLDAVYDACEDKSETSEDHEGSSSAVRQEEINKEFLSANALKEYEKQQKRNQASKETHMACEALKTFLGVFRDILLLTHGNDELIINSDCYTMLQDLAHNSELLGVEQCIAHVFDAQRELFQALSMRLVFEVFFFNIKESLYATHTAR